MKKIRWSKDVKFIPWVQAQYWNESVKTLVVGDSHYSGDTRAATSDFTSRMVEELAVEKTIAFFTRIAAMIKNKIPDGESERSSFWESVAFYNYLQELAGERPGVHISYRRFAESNAAFREVMRKLKPNLVIVLGHRVWRHMDDTDAVIGKPLIAKGVDERYLENWLYKTGDNETSLVFHVKHPSRGFTFAKFHTLYSAALKRFASSKH